MDIGDIDFKGALDGMLDIGLGRRRGHDESILNQGLAASRVITDVLIHLL